MNYSPKANVKVKKDPAEEAGSFFDGVRLFQV
jgi:hypothetical protein